MVMTSDMKGGAQHPTASGGISMILASGGGTSQRRDNSHIRWHTLEVQYKAAKHELKDAKIRQ